MTQSVLDTIWQNYTTGVLADGERPDFRFDEAFYRQRNPQVGARWKDLRLHFENVGEDHGLAPTRYREMRKEARDIDATLRKMVKDPDILAAFADEVDGVAELTFELIRLGHGIDERLCGFNANQYLNMYPDVRRSPLHPFEHFLLFGFKEGRRTFGDVLESVHPGGQTFDPGRQTCVICISKLEKPALVRALENHLAELATEFNVMLILTRDSAELAGIEAHITRTIITPTPHADLPILLSPADYPGGIFGLQLDLEASHITSTFTSMFIPFAALVSERHRMAAGPGAAFSVAIFAKVLAFSSEPVRDSWQQLLADVMVAQDCQMVLPLARNAQRNQDEDRKAEARIAHERAQARAALSSALGRDISDKKIVFGWGDVELRSGFDLFVLTAVMNRPAQNDLIFVWQGDGPNHEDLAVGVWLKKHIDEASQPVDDEQVFLVLPSNYAGLDLKAGADIYFHTARLEDDLASSHGLLEYGRPAVVFEGTGYLEDTHWRDVAQQYGTRVTRAPFGDLGAALERIQRLAKLPQDKITRPHQPPEPQTGPFLMLARRMSADLAKTTRFSCAGGTLDVPITHPPGEAFAAPRRRERDLMRTNARHIVWRDRQEAMDRLHALDGNVLQDKMSIETYADCPPDTAGLDRVMVHVHAYYLDTLADDLRNFSLLREAGGLVITTENPRKQQRIERMLDQAGLDGEVVLCPNQGRDILPFLRLVREYCEDPSDPWVHLHLKKSVGPERGGDVWKDFLFRIVAGDNTNVSSAISWMDQEDVGLVSAFDPYIAGWGPSRDVIPTARPEVQADIPEHPILFPIGNMFWTRAGVVQEMWEMFGNNYPWPNEPLANDGSVYHLIERLWPLAAARQGMRSVFLEKADQPRR